MAKGEAQASPKGEAGKKKAENGKDAAPVDEDLSEEDLKLKQKLESAVEKAMSKDTTEQKEGLETIR